LGSYSWEDAAEEKYCALELGINFFFFEDMDYGEILLKLVGPLLGENLIEYE
jgi:hypothetical protein